MCVPSAGGLVNFGSVDRGLIESQAGRMFWEIFGAVFAALFAIDTLRAWSNGSGATDVYLLRSSSSNALTRSLPLGSATLDA